MLNLLLCDMVKMSSSELSLSYDPDNIQWAIESHFYQVPVGSTSHSQTHNFVRAVMHDMGIMHSHYPLSNTSHRKSHKQKFTALQ